jgi:hypothetical protein
MTPEQFRENVNSGKTFLEFLRLLENDFSNSMFEEAENPSPPYDHTTRGWENVTISQFLEAAHAWAADSEIPEAPSWQWFATLLLAGKGYE